MLVDKQYPFLFPRVFTRRRTRRASLLSSGSTAVMSCSCCCLHLSLSLSLVNDTWRIRTRVTKDNIYASGHVPKSKYLVFECSTDDSSVYLEIPSCQMMERNWTGGARCERKKMRLNLHTAERRRRIFCGRWMSRQKYLYLYFSTWNQKMTSDVCIRTRRICVWQTQSVGDRNRMRPVANMERRRKLGSDVGRKFLPLNCFEISWNVVSPAP